MNVEIQKVLKSIIKELYSVELLPVVEAKLFDAIADCSSPVCFQLAKTLKKNPSEIALEIAKELASNQISGVEKIKALNGYLNFTLTSKALLLQVALVAGYECAKQKVYCKKSAVVEFGSPNVGKPLHVGHLRGTIIGESVSRLLESQGWKVTRMNYPADIGAQVAKLIYALETYKDLPEAVDERKILQYYVRVCEEEKTNLEIEKKTRDILQANELGDEKIEEEVRKIREVSMKAAQRVYDLLEVKYDVITGESEHVTKAKEITREALEKNLAFKDKDDTVIFKLEDFDIPNAVLLRSNCTTLYFTRDLALADYKMTNYSPSVSFFCTGSEQNLHFKQVIKALELLGRKYVEKMKHVGFGLVSSTEGKLSTREGKVIFLEDVINEVCEIAFKEAKSRNVSIDEKTAKIIGIGSLKFAFLKVTPEKNITFNPSQAVKFEGDTGAYLQYAYVRCIGILQKAQELPKAADIELNEYERELAKALAAFPSVVIQSSQSYSPHVLCNYLLKLAATYSTFYAQCSVNNALSKQSTQTRLLLVKATANALQKGLYLLGIQTPNKM